MGYKATVDVLILKDLQRRAVEYANHYVPGRPTVVLVPGGMGSRLLKTVEPYRPGVPFPEQPVFQKIWLSFGAVINGDILGLRMTRSEHDRGDRPVIASGEVSSRFAKKYDETQAYFSGDDPTFPANYTVFGYDWRKLPRLGANYLRQYLLFLRDEVAKRGHPDPRPQTTLFGHSFGGLVIKLFLNDVVDSGENPDEWLARFVSVGSPFYGTEDHLSRYYEGVDIINLFTPGGRDAVTDLVWSLPGPYALLPAPRTVLEPRFSQLGLNRYPVVDADQRTLELDPFEAAQRGRLPDFMTQPPDHLSFTVSRLVAASREFQEVDRELPTLRERIFHIRSTLRESPSPRSLRILWKDDDPDHPISTNGGNSDGTVPLWSAQLAWTPANQIFSARGIKHADLAEHRDILDAVAAIMQGNPVDLPAQSPQLAAAPREEVVALLEDIAAGHRDIEELVVQPDAIQRRFAAMLELA